MSTLNSSTSVPVEDRPADADHAGPDLVERHRAGLGAPAAREQAATARHDESEASVIMQVSDSKPTYIRYTRFVRATSSADSAAPV